MILLGGLCCLTPSLRAEVDLVLTPTPRTVDMGVEFDLNLFAISNTVDDQSIAAIDVVFTWDPQKVALVRVINNGPYNWLSSSFLSDPLNNSLSDGDAKYTALSQLGIDAIATPQGLLVTSFRFKALQLTDVSIVVIETSLGPIAITKVFGTESPIQDITGLLADAWISVVLPTDCDADGDFDMTELHRFQACFTGTLEPSNKPGYSTDPELCCSSFDHDDDGDIDLKDMSFLSGLLTDPG